MTAAGRFLAHYGVSAEYVVKWRLDAVAADVWYEALAVLLAERSPA